MQKPPVFFRPKKSLGQNFLVNTDATNEILSILSPGKDDALVEIGPGHGELSFKILPEVSEYFAIELDNLLYRSIKEKVPNRFRKNIYRENAASFPFEKLYSGKNLIIFGNLPYSVATPILIHLCNFFQIIKKVVVMLQKEVAYRVCSSPGSKDYGLLSLKIQNVFQGKLNQNFSPSNFRPRPKVDSTLITLLPREKPQIPGEDEWGFFNMSKELFGQRRKSIKNILRKRLLPGVPNSTLEDILRESNVSGTNRVEELSIEKLYKFYLLIKEQK